MGDKSTMMLKLIILLSVITTVASHEMATELPDSVVPEQRVADIQVSSKAAGKTMETSEVAQMQFPIDADAWLQNHHPLGLMQKSSKTVRDFGTFMDQLWKSSQQNL